MRFDARFGFELEEEERLVQKLRCNPYYQEMGSGADTQIRIKGIEYLNLASNNYLALANHPEVIAAMKAALDEYGASMCGTPVACGTVDIYQKAVEQACRFLGLEDAILYPSCYQANVSAIRALVKPRDVVFMDHDVHSSIIEGIRASGCKIKPFLHNDAEHLSELIRKSSGFQNRFVATESVFSTEGSIAPFDEIYRLALEHDVIPIVDDSHGIGVIGNSGKGILEAKRIENYEGIYTASTGKALGVSGGFVCGSRQIIKYLRYSSPGFLYSTAIPPTLIAGIMQVLEILEKHGAGLVNTLSENKQYLYGRLKALRFPLCPGEASICSLIGGSNYRTLRIYQALYEANILATPFIYPSVAKNAGVVRMIPRADLSKGQMDHVIRTLVAARERQPELFD
jgi:7-keto-8-aminopelargonate synthetase-like enzyme